jgi:two-component system sensor histidine kinase BarA
MIISYSVKSEMTFKSLTNIRDKDMKMESFKPSLSSLVSHQIITPVSGIIGILDILYETNLDSNQISYLRYIEKLAKELAASKSTIEQIFKDNMSN